MTLNFKPLITWENKILRRVALVFLTPVLLANYVLAAVKEFINYAKANYEDIWNGYDSFTDEYADIWKGKE